MSDLPLFHKNIWQPNEPEFMSRIIGNVPKYQYDLIGYIKKVGKDTIGDNIKAIAEFEGVNKKGKRITIDDILQEQPTLANAVNENCLSIADLTTGLTNLHINGAYILS